MKRFLTILLAFCVVFTSVEAASAEPRTGSLELIGASAILIDASTGEILYSKNPNEKHYPASTTKVLTALLTLENLELDHIITVDAETPFTEGSRIYLEEGERLSVEELMYGMMLESANDVAVAFAKEISGSVDAFAALMNKRAKQLGAKDSNFVNPNGLHEEEHVSTAYDIAMIAKYAMKNETFRHYVSTYQHNIAATNRQETRYLYNTNRLLYDNVHKVTVNGELRGCKYDGVTGIKTGYTSHAGGCLVAGAERNGTELIAVVMASTDMGRFQDCITLLDYGFANYKTVKMLEDGSDLGTVRVSHGAVRYVTARAAEAIDVTISADASANLLDTEVILDKKVKAPVEKGQVIGSVVISAGGETLRTIDAVAAESVEKGGPLSLIGIPDHVAKVIGIVLLSIVGGLILLLFIYIMVMRHKVKKRKAERARKKREALRLAQEQKSAWEEEYWRNRKYPQ